MEFLDTDDSDAAQPCPRDDDCVFTAHAVFPPPVTGMTACTESVVGAISRTIRVERYNWSNNARKIGRGFRITKALRATISPFRLIFRPKAKNGVFYMPANSGLAVFYNIMAVIAARLRKYRCVIHHHNFRYVDRFDWRIALLNRVLGSDDLQLVLCPEMERRYRNLYKPNTSFAIVPSTVQLLQTRFAPPSIPSICAGNVKEFCLGHMTNLQLAKGLDLVLEVFRTLRSADRSVVLILAGPIDTYKEQRLIDAARKEFGAAFEYRGPVYQDAKRKFLEDIHVSVYPTRNDAQPLVVTEAFAFGKPVISFARGCIPGLMGPATDWLVSPSDDFVDHAVKQISQWIDRPDTYREARMVARQRYDSLVTEATSSLHEFTDWIRNDTSGSFVRSCPRNSGTC